jgi:hypothetical protein
MVTDRGMMGVVDELPAPGRIEVDDLTYFAVHGPGRAYVRPLRRPDEPAAFGHTLPARPSPRATIEAVVTLAPRGGRTFRRYRWREPAR